MIWLFEKLFTASWENIDYNYGSHFDGSIFTAPVKGLYSFFATIVNPANSSIYTSSIYPQFKCYMNNNEIAESIVAERPGDVKHVILHTVLQLNKNDKVQLHAMCKRSFQGRTIEDDANMMQSYYEGRLVYFTE